MLQGGNVSWALSHVALQSSNLTEGQGLRAKSFQFQAHLYALHTRLCPQQGVRVKRNCKHGQVEGILLVVVSVRVF